MIKLKYIGRGLFLLLVKRTLHKRTLHKKDFTQMCDAGVWGHSPQQVEVYAEGMVSELASDPCCRHVLQLVHIVIENRLP